MGDIADWLTDKAMTDVERWFEDEDIADDLALNEGPPEDMEDGVEEVE